MLYAAIKDNVPTIDIKLRSYPSWYNAEIISLIKAKHKFRKLYIKSGRDVLSPAYNRYCEFRTNVKRMQKLLYTEYLSNIASEIKVNPK